MSTRKQINQKSNCEILNEYRKMQKDTGMIIQGTSRKQDLDDNSPSQSLINSYVPERHQKRFVNCSVENAAQCKDQTCPNNIGGK